MNLADLRVTEVGLGALQGLTEFLPISSSGHLQAVRTLIPGSATSDLNFDILVHLATLGSVFTIYWRDWRGLLWGGSEWTPQIRRDWFIAIVIGCIPAGLAGLLLKDTIETLSDRYPLSISGFWLVSAAILYSSRNLDRDILKPIDWKAALWIGSWQVLALFPGVSRSGTTIVAALWFGIGRAEAARYSFFMATPLIVAATGLQLLETLESETSLSSTPWGSYLVGAVAAFLTGVFALKLLVGMLTRGALYGWSYYLVAVAGLYALWQFLHPT